MASRNAKRATWGAKSAHHLQLLLEMFPRATNRYLAIKLRCSPRTVLKWRNCLTRSHSIDDAVRRTRQRSEVVLSRRRELRRLIRMKRMKDDRVRFKFPSAAALAAELKRRGHSCVSKTTVLRDLEQMKYNARVRPKVPTVDPKKQVDRFKFAQKLLKTAPKGRRYMFSDEVYVSCNDTCHRFQWLAPGEQATRRHNERWPKNLMVAGAIAHNFKWLKIVHVPGKVRVVNGKKKKGFLGTDYLEKVLKEVIVVCRNRKLFFQQDMAKVHTEKANLDYIDSQGVEHFGKKWPANSPQLNPIEQMWPHLKKGIGDELPTNHKELEAAVFKAWDAIPMKLVNTLVDSFQDKLKKCVETKGDMK